MENKKIIRAADHLPKPNTDCSGEDFCLTGTDQLLINLFGDRPNYNDQKFEDIWQEIFDAEDEVSIAYCLKQGVDVMDDDGEPVAGWRDIAVMLKAIEKGLLKVEGKE